MRERSFGIPACLALLLVCPLSQATLIEIQKDYGLFGHLWNTDNTMSDGFAVPWCAPTATANSLIYLQNKYPDIYRDRLTPYSYLDMRDELVGLMGAWTDGATPRAWWEGKYDYIQSKAPYSTVFRGMVWEGLNDPNPGTWNGGSALQEGPPTWDFLWTELSRCEDVEIGIYWWDAAHTNMSGHALTLTSLSVEDVNGNGSWDWDLQEEARIDYLDPNNPTQLFWADLFVQDGLLNFGWNNGGANNPEFVMIGLAYAESPRVPDVAPTVSLLVIGLIAVSVSRRKKQECVNP